MHSTLGDPMRHTVPLAGLGLVALVLLAGLVLVASAGAHVVDGTYRSDVTAENCGSYDACGSGQSGGSSDSTSSSSSGGYSIPSYIVQCESGGDYSARNPSGAGGAYQMMPGTFHAYGGSGDPASASKAEQDRVAARIYAAEGSAPWSCG